MLFPGEVFIVEDIGRRANQLEADTQPALVADREQITVVHHRFMGLAMVFVVDHFIDSTFEHRLAGQEDIGMLPGFVPMARLLVSRLSYRGWCPQCFAAQDEFRWVGSVHFL